MLPGSWNGDVSRELQAGPANEPGQRMRRAAELALRQAYALCPKSPEAVYRYINYLADTQRMVDAIALVEMSVKISPDSIPLSLLLSQLKEKKG